ncbi:hypothetical protein KQX54_017272 [Cotesia glomerata]|uniref:Uncharacterized protein n=1 Tax=Cotesia glomerata TaxID=32391 RepID=A0AAV7IG61_COTGL|nr:hypothetical protein KQX54_017272 [Cotesia glomerata]
MVGEDESLHSTQGITNYSGMLLPLKQPQTSCISAGIIINGHRERVYLGIAQKRLYLLWKDLDSTEATSGRCFCKLFVRINKCPGMGGAGLLGDWVEYKLRLTLVLGLFASESNSVEVKRE